MRPLLLLMLLALPVPAMAATPAAWASMLADASAACRKASGLRTPTIRGEAVTFSDTAGKTALLVTGIWRPAHMKGARATMLCLYDRAARTAEVQEARGWTAPTR